MLGHEKVFLEF